MIEKLKRRIVGNNENSKTFQRAMAQKADGRELKYVTEHIQNEDSVIGKNGRIVFHHDKITIDCAGETLFCSKIGEVKLSDLMSLDGVVLSGIDISHGGMKRTIIAYYKYYR